MRNKKADWEKLGAVAIPTAAQFAVLDCLFRGLDECSEQGTTWKACERRGWIEDGHCGQRLCAMCASNTCYRWQLTQAGYDAHSRWKGPRPQSGS